MNVLRALRQLLAIPFRFHLAGSFCIVLVVTSVLALQVMDRRRFASGDIHRDVMDRWGAPIAQPAPSVRWVPSGTVFNTLEALPLDRQQVEVDARMSYRKRGLVYFSGFEFAFRGSYVVHNREGRDIDIAFVFPIDLERNKVLLSDLSFSVDGRPARIDLSKGADKLVWTGRLKDGTEAAFAIAYHGRGLDSFTYKLDPALPVRGFRMTMAVTGGSNFDYADGVVSASRVTRTGDGVVLGWEFASLESGVPVGAIVPSEKSFDRILATMVARSWAGFLAFFAGLALLAAWLDRRLRPHESYLFAASYALFFVLVAYLAAYVHFYLAFAIAALVITLLLVHYTRRVLAPAAGRYMTALVVAFLLVPSIAVILEGHTGLVYTLEVLACLVAAMALTTRTEFRTVSTRLTSPAQA
jgi:hypothetical protein